MWNVRIKAFAFWYTNYISCFFWCFGAYVVHPNRVIGKYRSGIIFKNYDDNFSKKAQKIIVFSKTNKQVSEFFEISINTIPNTNNTISFFKIPNITILIFVI